MRILAVAFWVVVALVACNRPGPSTDSKSNWLRECATQRECGEGLSCICGVCTAVCTGARECDRPDGEARCTDPVQAGLPAACTEPLEASGESVCLAGCSTSAQCGAAQVCVMGSCIAAAVANVQTGSDRGVAGTGGRQSIAGSAAAAMQSAGDPAALQPAGDAGSQPPPSDGGPLPDAAMTPADGGGALPDAAVGCELAGTCCSVDRPCADGLVCHVDGSCVEPGVADADGVATLAGAFRNAPVLFAANDTYVFGVDSVFFTSGPLLRWPVSGGPSEPVTRESFVFASETRVLVDGDVVYFNAAVDPVVDPNATLFRVPLDEPEATAEALGGMGFYMVQDDEFLFFTSVQNASVVRMRKDMPSDRQTVYSPPSGAFWRIDGLALNSDTLFVLDGMPQNPSSFIVRGVDKATLAPNPIARDGVDPLSPTFLSATEDHVILAEGEAIERIDLTTGASTRWPIRVASMAQLGGSLFLTDLPTGENPVVLQRLDVAVGAPTRPVLTAAYVRSVVPTPGAIFAVVSSDGDNWSIVRVAPP